MSKEVYQFSIEDFQNQVEEAKNYIIREHATNLMILAAATIENGERAETIVSEAYKELLKHAKEFHSQAAIKDFLYEKVKENCKKFLDKEESN